MWECLSYSCWRTSSFGAVFCTDSLCICLVVIYTLTFSFLWLQGFLTSTFIEKKIPLELGWDFFFHWLKHSSAFLFPTCLLCILGTQLCLCFSAADLEQVHSHCSLYPSLVHHLPSLTMFCLWNLHFVASSYLRNGNINSVLCRWPQQ